MNKQQRFEIYIDNYERLSIAVFEDTQTDYEKFYLHGADTYDLIKKLASREIIDFYAYRNKDDAVIEYKNYIINLNECSRLLKKRGMGPIVRSLKEYQENKNLRKYQNTTSNTYINNVSNDYKERIPKPETKPIKRRVKRKNKYKSRIIAGALVLSVMLGGTACYAIQQKGEDIDNHIVWEETIDYDVKEEKNYVTLNYKPEKPSVTQDLNISIDYNDRSTLEKVYITKAYYGELLEKYAKQYGLDPNLVLAIATQERGIHSSDKDFGGATGLMQIQNSVWEEENIKAYNFNTNKNESLHITKNMIKDVGYNIRIGCMYLQNCMKYMNYNVVAAVQCYNMGFGNMSKILNAYSKEINKSVDEILADKNDTGWLKYRNLINVGDKNYVENVFSWLGPKIDLNTTTTNNKIIISNITNTTESKKIY